MSGHYSIYLITGIKYIMLCGQQTVACHLSLIEDQQMQISQAVWGYLTNPVILDISLATLWQHILKPLSILAIIPELICDVEPPLFCWYTLILYVSFWKFFPDDLQLNNIFMGKCILALLLQYLDSLIYSSHTRHGRRHM